MQQVTLHERSQPLFQVAGLAAEEAVESLRGTHLDDRAAGSLIAMMRASAARLVLDECGESSIHGADSAR